MNHILATHTYMNKNEEPLSVYGASGFIGSHFTKMHSSRCVSIPRDQDLPETNNILYFISTTHNYHIFDDTCIDIDTNLKKLMRVLDACRERYGSRFTFNFISSWFVYGMNCSLNTKETDHCDPRGFYSITKRAAEQMLVCYCSTYGIGYRIMRMTNIIGKGDTKVSSRKNALQHMINLLRQGKEVCLYDGGGGIRDFMDVGDACRAIDVCVRNSPLNEVVNISNHEPKPIVDIIHHCKKRLNSTSTITSVETPPFHRIVQVKDVCLNNDKIKSYGYTQSIDAISAINNLLQE